MLSNDRDFRELRLPNTLQLTPDHTSLVVGRLLREHYQRLVEEDVPDRLRNLLNQIDDRERAAMHASAR
ncbi:NepR family anti-sigma factor [Microvirga pudoricolor]|uniref:NepR family anti-sigma factor n=1 Tax=Microvirga pudoricolor TaxID=2778729 RepID=UPI00194DF4B5|nr:NepR family anti-sigma factor [Microvirga pudoricolor]MBM6595651.1 hypothetical protein [Microvirga pudoricolor]